jgi:hypothetical protein
MMNLRKDTGPKCTLIQSDVQTFLYDKYFGNCTVRVYFIYVKTTHERHSRG